MKTPHLFRAALLTALCCLGSAQFGVAGSATWNLNPTSSDWNTAANWTPATVPNSPSDIATFGVSNTTSITLTQFDNTNANVLFNPGASAFSVTAGANVSLSFGTTGVTNNSGVTQNFAAGPGGGDTSELTFQGTATAGNQTVFTANGGTSPITRNAIVFLGGDAGTATLHATGGVSGGSGGEVVFFDGSTANAATVIIDGGVGNNSQAAGYARIDTEDTIATAGDATFTINGAPNPGGRGGLLQFGSFTNSSPTAGNATLIANAGTDGGPGGSIAFDETSTGGTARVELFGNGQLDLTRHVAPGITIGSLEGDGRVLLGANNLTIGANTLSTTFSGVISGTGSLAKVGPGALTLTGPNTYTGLTQVKQGRLLIKDRTGSLTIIKGSVAVNGGTFGGSGLVNGKVVVGSSSGRPGVLEPNELHGGNFIISQSLTFKSASTCQIDLDSGGSLGVYSNVWAKGVTIEEGALFTMKDFGNSSLAGDFVMINNTGSRPIAGEFANLPEGGSIVVGQNTFYATYHGGDGNDLLFSTTPP